MNGNRCPTCGESLFPIVPRQTTWRDVETFLQDARFAGAAQASSERWIHPGRYCMRHGGQGLGDYGPGELGDDHEYRVFLRSWGPRREEVTLVLHDRIGGSLPDVNDIADAARPELARGGLGEVSPLCERLEQLGAGIEVEQRERDSGAQVQALPSPPALFTTIRRLRATDADLDLDSVFDDEGNLAGTMETAGAPESEAPDPSQQALDAMLAGVTRVRIVDGGVSEGEVLGDQVLLAVGEPATIASLGECLAILEDPETFGHCMCFGDQAMEFYDGDGLAATIGLHHGVSIRWDAWKHDAQLRDGAKLREWLAERGVPGPSEQFEAGRRVGEEIENAYEAWRAATPPCLLPLWNAMMDFRGDTAPLQQALEEAFPDVHVRILELFRWFGSGRGRWSGYPSYEEVAERLLLEYPTAVLVEALANDPDAPAHTEGAARYFGGWNFRNQKKELHLVPAALKQRLLEHALEHSHADNIPAARAAFGE